MSTITYRGIDLGDVCSAQVAGRPVNELAVETMRMAGRPGAVSVSSWVPPEDVQVRLFLDPGWRPTIANDTKGLKGDKDDPDDTGP